MLTQRIESRLQQIQPAAGEFHSKAKWEKAGVNVPSFDSQIAAVASCNSLILVTRNTGEFEGIGIKTLNPFL